ncbi:MAG: hypothetical protein P1U62_08915 [Alteraurantiacibacter sp. bin_em_oilr2.035]|nr:hypothetical protein [Alteraurantiacibacter sp. bin_em_oilr2.035]
MTHQTGQIVYHLQEAAPLAQSLASNFSPVGVANIAVNAVQNEVNRRAIERVASAVDALTEVAHVNLALSAAGIGVSAAGFAIIAKRLDRIEAQMASVEDKIDQVISKIEEATQREAQDLFSNIRGLATLYEDSWSLSDIGRAERDRQRIWQDGAALQDMTERRAEHALGTPALGYDAARPHLEAFALVTGLRIAALLACDEIETARRVEQDTYQRIDRLTGSLGLADLLPDAMQERSQPGSQEWVIERARAGREWRPVVSEIRLREQALATRTAALPLLEEAGVRPREWLEQARSEEEADLLCLGKPAGKARPKPG